MAQQEHGSDVDGRPAMPGVVIIPMIGSSVCSLDDSGPSVTGWREPPAWRRK
jgi:hypothetical protein